MEERSSGLNWDEKCLREVQREAMRRKTHHLCTLCSTLHAPSMSRCRVACPTAGKLLLYYRIFKDVRGRVGEPGL